jgi:flagellar hook-associated protein 1 FlgK
MSSFAGISQALMAVLSMQQAMEVTEHNVANANTTGFHRQSAILSANTPQSTGGWVGSSSAGQIGTGVILSEVRRFNTDFMDVRLRTEAGEVARWSVQHSYLQQIETSLGESGEDSLSLRMDDFWSAWQAVSAEPDQVDLRATLLESAKQLAEAFNGRIVRLEDLRRSQNLEIYQRVDEINKISTQVADLNAEISRVKAIGDSPNDYIDQRAQLLDRLSEIAGAVSYPQNDGQVLVSIGGHALVVGDKSFQLTANPDPLDLSQVDISFVADGKQLNPPSGELLGFEDVRDRVIVEQIDQLDELASMMIEKVNILHRSGYGLNDTGATPAGRDFFTGTDAATMQVNADLDNLANIAAALRPNSAGDGELARQIAEVRSTALFMGTPPALTVTPSGGWTGGITAASAGHAVFEGVDTLVNGNYTVNINVTSGGASTVELLSGGTALNISADGTSSGAAALVLNFTHDAVNGNVIDLGNGLQITIDAAATGATSQDVTYTATGASNPHQFDGVRVADLALEVSSAATNARDHTYVQTALNEQIESEAGVNLDEEAANMVKFQRAYQASARMMTALDEMLNTIINGMGLVGRS